MNKILEPTIASLSQVAKELAQGDIAVLPTETVYGLAASIEHPSAIEAIFRAKGRPNDNPLIVHIHSMEQLTEYSLTETQFAQLIGKSRLYNFLPKKEKDFYFFKRN